VSSFDQPRQRQVPLHFSGTINGSPVIQVLSEKTLVVAIKPNCDGCRDFVHSTLDELAHVEVLVVSESADGATEWANGHQEVLIAPGILSELGIKWPPFFVLIDPASSMIITEGVVFGPSQIAKEIAPFLI
jgi:hypothetical protein